MVAVAADDYFPFDSGPGASRTEDAWRKMMRRILTSGVFAGMSNELEVFADSTGRQVKLRPGACWLEGHYGEITSGIKTLPVSENGTAQPRLDRAVMRVDFAANKIEFEVKPGTPGVSPTAPGLTQNTSRWEESLATIGPLAGGYSTITVGQVNRFGQWKLAGQGQFTPLAIKTSDQSVNNNATTMINCTEVFTPLAASATYVFEMYLVYSCGPDGDMVFIFDTPAGSVGRLSVHSLPDAVVATSNTNSQRFTEMNARSRDLTSTTTIPGDTDYPSSDIQMAAIVKGYITTGTAAGNLQLQFRQRVSTGVGAIVRTGTFLEARRTH